MPFVNGMRWLEGHYDLIGPDFVHPDPEGHRIWAASSPRRCAPWAPDRAVRSGGSGRIGRIGREIPLPPMRLRSHRDSDEDFRALAADLAGCSTSTA